MRSLILASALLGAAHAAAAQEAQAGDPAGMTCAAFVALDAAGQAQALLALRAAYNGDPEPTAGARPDPAAAKIAGLRTSCEGVPDALAADAMIAAHADYE